MKGRGFLGQLATFSSSSSDCVRRTCHTLDSRLPAMAKLLVAFSVLRPSVPVQIFGRFSKTNGI